MSRWAPPLICLTIAFVFFGDSLFLDRSLIPTGALYSEQPWKSENPELAGDVAQQYDLIQQFYPWADYFKNSVWSGRFPLWNPYNYLGTPFFANPQTALLFPLTWLHLLLPLRYSFSLILILKMAIGLMGMYYWLRSLGLKVEAGLIGAVIYSLSMNTSSSLFFPYSNVTVLLPWAFLSMRATLQKPTSLRFLCLTSTLVLIVFAGQPQSALTAFLALTVYGVFFSESDSLPRKIGIQVASFVLAGLISAIQWAPSFAYVAESMVPSGPRIIKSTYPFGIENFLTLLVPDFFGSLVGGGYWGFPGYHYTAFYSSILAILLLPFAFRRGVRPVLFPILLGLFTMGVLLGVPLFENLLDLPGFDLLRRHRFSFLLIFALSELAARGADSIRSHAWLRNWKLLLLGCTLALVMMITGSGFWLFKDYLAQLDPQGMALRSAIRTGVFALAAVAAALLVKRRLAGWLLFLLVLVDLAWVSFPLNPRGTASSLFPPSKLAATLSRDSELPRIFSFHPVFNPNTTMVYGLQDVRGYDVITPRRLFRFMQQIDSDLGNLFPWLNRFKREGIHPWTLMLEAVDEALAADQGDLRKYLESDSYWTVGIKKVENRILFDLLQIKYVLGPRPKGFDGYDKLFPELKVPVHRNAEAVAARLYLDWRESSESQVFTTMKDLDLDKTVVVEASMAAPVVEIAEKNTLALIPAGRNVDGNSYVVESDQAVVLVEFNRFSSGWRAYLDGRKELKVFPAHFLFRGVRVPAGKHVVDFRYEPRSFRYGVLLSAAGMLCLLVSLVANLPKRMTSKTDSGR